MIEKWNRRKHTQKRWEAIAMVLTNRPGNEPLSEEEKDELYLTLMVTMSLYSHGTCMNKQTYRLLFLLKRVLADKRLIDDIKVLEYISMAHIIYKKRFMNKKVKERLIAHSLQMAQIYLSGLQKRLRANPLVPGHFLEGPHV